MHKLTTHSFTDFSRTGAIILFILSGTFINSFAQTGSFSGTIGKYSFSVSNIAVSNDLMCFSAFSVFYCGGTHPEESSYGMNYNLNTHQKIASSDYLNPGKEKEFDERIFAYLAQENPGYFGSGIRLLPSFPHYKALCLDPEWSVIPYSEVKDLLKPEYLRMVNGLKP